LCARPDWSLRCAVVTEFKISSFCNWGNCVEVGQAPDGFVLVRDTKDPQRLTSLSFSAAEWSAFVLGAKAGEFDFGTLDH
jgi:hypothetical protein